MNNHTNKPSHLKLVTTSLVFAASQAGAQDLIHKAPPQDMPIAIAGATIHPMTGPSIGTGYILFDKGIITEVGEGDRVFTATTKATPEVLAATAINPDSTLIPVTRANGILTFGSFPTGGSVPGRISIVSADGWTWEDMSVKQDAGLAINWPSMRPSNNWWADEPDARQMERINERLDEIDELFQQALSYRDGDRSPQDIRFDAMLSVIPSAEGNDPENPVFISANDVDQINAAVTWAIDLGLRPVIVGGTDATLSAALLKQHDVPVIITGTHKFPKRADQPHDEAFTLPIELTELGIRWCMASADDTAHERNLPYNVSKAVAFGLDHDAGMRGLTIDTARILEIDDLVGSLENGKQATLIVTTGSPLEVITNPVMAFVQGRQISLESKQSELAEKYREKYRQLGLTRDE